MRGLLDERITWMRGLLDERIIGWDDYWILYLQIKSWSGHTEGQPDFFLKGAYLCRKQIY